MEGKQTTKTNCCGLIQQARRTRLSCFKDGDDDRTIRSWILLQNNRWFGTLFNSAGGKHLNFHSRLGDSRPLTRYNGSETATGLHSPTGIAKYSHECPYDTCVWWLYAPRVKPGCHGQLFPALAYLLTMPQHAPTRSVSPKLVPCGCRGQ